MLDMPVQKPPYLSVEEKRRYAKLLALPEERAERRFLLALFEWQALTVGFEIPGSDVEWDSPTLGHRIKLSEILYILLSACTDILDAVNQTRGAKPLSEVRQLAASSISGVRAALSAGDVKGSPDHVEIFIRTMEMLSALDGMLDSVGS
jgi:hypothetical protein